MTAIFTKKSHKIKFSIQSIFWLRAASVKNAQNIQQNKQEIQLRAVSKLNFMQMITRNFWKLNISNKLNKNVVNLLSQSNSTTVTVIQNFSVISTVTCEFSTTKSIIFVNLMFELIYFDLVVNEFSTSMNDDRMIFLMKNTLILYSKSIVLTVQSHDRKSFEDDAELSTMKHVKIQMNFNRNSLDFCSIMKQDYVNWNFVMKAKIKSLEKNEIFEITFLFLKKTAIDSRWVFKCKKETVSTVKQTDKNHDQNVDNLLSKRWAVQHQQKWESMKIKTHYKIYLVVKNYEQWYEVDF